MINGLPGKPAAVLALLALLSAPAALAENGGTTPVLSPGQEIIGVSFRGLHRAYPLELFSRSMIISDEIRHQELVIFHDSASNVTTAYFCMILGEPIVFSGQIIGTVADDLTTITRWDMVSGEAVGGNLSGMNLTALRFVRTSWGEWLSSHPKTTIYTRLLVR